MTAPAQPTTGGVCRSVGSSREPQCTAPLYLPPTSNVTDKGGLLQEYCPGDGTAVAAAETTLAPAPNSSTKEGGIPGMIKPNGESTAVGSPGSGPLLLEVAAVASEQRLRAC